MVRWEKQYLLPSKMWKGAYHCCWSGKWKLKKQLGFCYKHCCTNHGVPLFFPGDYVKAVRKWKRNSKNSIFSEAKRQSTHFKWCEITSNPRWDQAESKEKVKRSIKKKQRAQRDRSKIVAEYTFCRNKDSPWNAKSHLYVCIHYLWLYHRLS